MNTESSISYEEANVEPPSGLNYLQNINLKLTSEKQSKPDFPVNERTLQFLARHFPGTSLNEWNNWRWQIQNSYTSYAQLQTILHLSDDEIKPTDNGFNLPIRITPYYASLLDPNDSNQALRKSVVPVFDELITTPEEKADPLGEENYSPVNHIVHRYPDRVLFLVTGFCSTYCRYCTRSHMVSKKDKCHSSINEWDIAIDYIRNNTQVRDVLISGGDPLTLSDARLEYLLSKLRAIEHVEIIRIGTKVPVVLPQRITPMLVKILRKYHPLLISIHFTHPDELTPETHFACTRLADAGIPLGSQTVLLKGVNDEISIFKELTHKLLKARVRPYYLYQCDPIPGSAHFRTPVSKGLEIIKGLRGFTSGYAIPHYVIDAPGGGGKIPLLPDYLQSIDDEQVVLKNYEGKTFYYPNQKD
ncbi:MAG: KamA family radical SAM protein [Bacteroidales bacterium]|nr:KamA family radical SAM protein [Bacteroidales bacterium]